MPTPLQLLPPCSHRVTPRSGLQSAPAWGPEHGDRRHRCRQLLVPGASGGPLATPRICLRGHGSVSLGFLGIWEYSGTGGHRSNLRKPVGLELIRASPRNPIGGGISLATSGLAASYGAASASNCGCSGNHPKVAWSTLINVEVTARGVVSEAAKDAARTKVGRLDRFVEGPTTRRPGRARPGAQPADRATRRERRVRSTSRVDRSGRGSRPSPWKRRSTSLPSISSGSSGARSNARSPGIASLRRAHRGNGDTARVRALARAPELHGAPVTSAYQMRP